MDGLCKQTRKGIRSAMRLSVDNINQESPYWVIQLDELTFRFVTKVSALLAFETTEYTIVERSSKGTGFDYMLGDKNDTLFIPKARLEISGIKTETESNSIEKRFKQKALQTDISDKSGLPAYISIIEFSTPKAVFDLKRIAI